MFLVKVVLISLFLTLFVHGDPNPMLYDLPKLVHLAVTGDPNYMYVSWTTTCMLTFFTFLHFIQIFTVPTESYVNVWEQGNSTYTTFSGTQSSYLLSAGWTHHVKIGGLSHNKLYNYNCGSDETGWSSNFTFKAGPPPGDRNNHTYIMYGDMGIVQYSYYTVEHVSKMVDEWDIDFIYHSGDMGYGDDRASMYYELCWNLFFAQLSIPMTKVPYMVAPGNHEESCGSDSCHFYANNFTVYNHRFKMPYEESGAPTNMWFSFDYANVHFITISTETDFPDWFGIFFCFFQYFICLPLELVALIPVIPLEINWDG